MIDVQDDGGPFSWGILIIGEPRRVQGGGYWGSMMLWHGPFSLRSEIFGIDEQAEQEISLWPDWIHLGK